MSSDGESMAYGLVVDDHPLVARGITEFLGTHPLLSGAVHVQAAEAAWPVMAARGAPAVALVDFWMGADTAMDFVHALLQQQPGTRVIGHSGDTRPELIESLRSGGAHGFVGKQEPPAVLHQAVTQVLAGGLWFAPGPEPAPAADAQHMLPVSAQAMGLTSRQGQVLDLLLDGMPNKRIASTLGLSEHTVKEHVSAIFLRLGVSSRLEVMHVMRGRRLSGA